VSVIWLQKILQNLFIRTHTPVRFIPALVRVLKLFLAPYGRLKQGFMVGLKTGQSFGEGMDYTVMNGHRGVRTGFEEAASYINARLICYQ
jgi:hypothetical protein